MSDSSSLEGEFRSYGFLAPHISEVEESIRRDLENEIQLLRDLNTYATEMVMKYAAFAEGETTLHPKVIGVVSGFRTLSNLQGAILMLERGMAVEAKILIRSIYENAFCIGALHSSPERFISAFRSDNFAAKRSLAKSLKAFELNAAQLSELEAASEKLAKGNFLPVHEMADLALLSPMYLFYKKLSDEATHHSATALSRYLDTQSGGWTGFLFCPAETDELKEVAFYCGNSIFCFIMAFSQLLEVEDVDGRQPLLFERVKGLEENLSRSGST